MGLSVKGINYDVGTEYFAGESSRALWSEFDVARDMRAIRRDLHANSVNLLGSDLSRLARAAEIAQREGLAVSLQPRRIEGDRRQMLTFLEQCAREAERLRQHGPVTLNTGCELTLFTRGFLPGRTFLARMRNLRWSWPLLPLAQRRLLRHLRKVVQVARAAFGGPITYGAGVWERVDWSGFDLVGVNLYRDRENEATYADDLRRLRRHGRPVVITEFGCCTFEGAQRVGGDGWRIVDYRQDPPVIPSGYVRSEQAQADLIGELLDLFAREGVHGAYVYTFLEADQTHHPDARRDLDIASYGVVKVLPPSPGQTGLRWERKRAFTAIAERFRPA